MVWYVVKEFGIVVLNRIDLVVYVGGDVYCVLCISEVKLCFVILLLFIVNFRNRFEVLVMI